MKQLRVFAPIKGPTGYEIIARDIIEQLSGQGVQVALEEFRNWGPFEVGLWPSQHVTLGKALTTKLHPQGSPVTSLNICLPEQVQINDAYRNVIYTMFETDRIPGNWVAALENVDEVLVPTDFNRWSFTRSGVPAAKIGVLPLGYNPERYNENVAPLPLQCGDRRLSDFPVRFLTVCEITDRKNFWGTLTAFYGVASLIGPENCCLLLKVGNYTAPIPLSQTISQFRLALIKEQKIPDLPYNVFNYTPLLPEEAHPHFLRAGTHYLSLSLGEGWDLTAMQAAACGLHLLVPKHTAYQCWLEDASVSFLPINHKVDAQQAGATGRLYAGSKWYAVDLPASIPIIANAVTDPTISDLKRKRMRESIKAYQWPNLTSQYINALHL